MLAQKSGFCRAAATALATPWRQQLRDARPASARRRALLLGLTAVPLLLAGCTGTQAPAAPAAASSTVASAAARHASDTAPAAAQMVCSDEIRSLATDFLGLDSLPAPQAAWVDPVYTCTYSPPMGPLVLSVTVAPSNTAAGKQLETMRRQLGAEQPTSGLGEQAYGAPSGIIVAVKDNMVLRVDASALPDDLGASHQPRTALARYLAAVVFSCWTGAH